MLPAAPPPPPALIPSCEEIEAGLLAQFENMQKKKRGRPRIGERAMTAAERQERSRAQRGERTAIAALEKARQDAADAAQREYWDDIAVVQREHRDRTGTLSGEISGGDVSNKVTGEPRIKSRSKGHDPRLFERGVRKLQDLKETEECWADHHNFFSPAKWDAADKEWFSQKLAERECAETENGFCCDVCGFESSWRPAVIAHFLEFHRRYIRAEFRYGQFRQPDPVKLAKKPVRCTPEDHDRWRRIFADRLPVECKWCGKEITAAAPAGIIVTEPGKSDTNT